jgi:hypothetical protein
MRVWIALFQREARTGIASRIDYIASMAMWRTNVWATALAR